MIFQFILNFLSLCIHFLAAGLQTESVLVQNWHLLFSRRRAMRPHLFQKNPWPERIHVHGFPFPKISPKGAKSGLKGMEGTLVQRQRGGLGVERSEIRRLPLSFLRFSGQRGRRMIDAAAPSKRVKELPFSPANFFAVFTPPIHALSPPLLFPS